MPVTFTEQPITATWNGRHYNGTYREEDGRLYVNSAYGSKILPAGRRKAGLKEAARDALFEIVKERGR